MSDQKTEQYVRDPDHERHDGHRCNPDGPCDVERVIPSYDVWPSLREELAAGRIIVVLPDSIPLAEGRQAAAMALLGMPTPGDPEVRLVVPKDGGR